ncbi:hypothetical protein [Lutispora saccharofermentans]|uniref:Uncharacterized protein n=1 Tax=Lutispora saccharofermentans TaxID=3024236 RepID=A0ABT1NDJ8_9FIRM|nr:hypothetical protein [Lutispora saccharofermentans]MCQ1529332.1 hypothetical protein [Lutispora saccharofermentans]
MRFVFYNKLFSGLSISLAISFIIGELILKSNIYFIFSASCFGAIYLLLGWICYLKLDGVTFFKSKGVYNIDEYDSSFENKELSEEQVTKAAMYAYILCGIMLLLGAQLIPSFEPSWLSPNRNMFPR